jgi:hypothetical protein
MLIKEEGFEPEKPPALFRNLVTNPVLLPHRYDSLKSLFANSFPGRLFHPAIWLDLTVGS